MRKCIFALLVCALLVVGGLASAEPLYLVKDGQAASTIVIPDDADRWTKTPAQWLRDYIKKVTGATIKIVPESKTPEGTLIVLGNTKLAWKAGVNLAGLKWDACKLVVKDNVLYLRGVDVTDMKEYGPKGAMRAAAIFLERFCGIRWLVPAPEGEYVPKRPDVSVPGDLNVISTPAFLYARPCFYGNTYTSPAPYANNTRVAVKLRSYGGHSYYPWLPAEKYFKDHPEYFALVKGKRTPHGNHLCLSNPEVRKILLREIRKRFDEGYDWVQLGQEDGFKACECAACSALDSYTDHGHLKPGYTQWRDQLKDYPCERLLGLHRWIAEECYKSHPDKTVHLLVYGPTLMPSKKFNKWPPNVVAEMCSREPEIVNLWKDKVRALTGYIYIFDITLHGGLGVRATPESIAEIVREMHEMGYIGVATCICGHNWGLEGPVYYVEAKLLGDPDLEERELVKEYCRGLFGKAAQAMLDFFELLYTRGDIRELTGDEADRFVYLYPPFFLERLERFLIKAERDADTEPARQWVKLSRDHFDYMNYLVRMIVAYRAYQVNPDEWTWAKVRQAVRAFEGWRDKVIRYEKSYADRWFPGYSRFCNFLTAEGTQRAYYSSWWNRREKVLKDGARGTSVGYGVGSEIRLPLILDMSRQPIVKPVVVRRAKRPPSMDGAMTDEVWTTAEPAFLHNMSASKTEIQASFRVLYDDNCLYVGWECEEPEPDKMRLEETGPDGPAYSRECVEFFLDVDGTRRRYVHFIAAAQKNSYYDERCGFKKIGSWDDSWNPKWTYAHNVDKQNKRWTLEMRIPFSELGTAAPAPGTEWLGNFGRERYVGVKLFAPGIFIWSQKEAYGLNTPLNFGVIRFE